MSEGFPFFRKSSIMVSHFLRWDMETLAKPYPGKSTSHHLNTIAFFVDAFNGKMIDELGFTRRCGSFGQPINIGNHIDQR